MSQHAPPSEPLVVVLGSTGTGKSDLAVELACRFNGEIINADAMQMYKGLPIITNKISVEEQRGIPHHLLGNIGLEEPTWTVHQFRQEASNIIREIRSRGRLPVIVGGTQYYTDGLLFDDRLVFKDLDGDETQVNGTEDPKPTAAEMQDAVRPFQDAPTESIMAKLREVDPVMADRWHPNDRRKIWRSLEIYLTTGRRASDIYAEQQKRKEAKRQAAPEACWKALLFWVYSKPEVLNDRLGRRVDGMLENGLLEETRELYDYLREATANGTTIDRTSGIWQSIGFGEMEPYLESLHNGVDGDALEALKHSGLEAVKSATRRYAKYQNRWITYKTLPLVKEEGALGHLFLMDSTDVSRWTTEVADKAAATTEQYLRGETPLSPAPQDLSETAAEVLRSAVAASERQVTPCSKTCDVCRTTLLSEELWQRHVSGNRHKRAVQAAKRRALVAVRANERALVVREETTAVCDSGQGDCAQESPSLLT